MKKTQFKENLKIHQNTVLAGLFVILLIGIFAWLYVSKVHGPGMRRNEQLKISHRRSNQHHSDPNLIIIPPPLRGTWYYYNDVRGRQTLEKIRLTTHMVRESMIFDSRQIRKKYHHPDSQALHKLQNQYPAALEGVIKKDGNQKSLLVYDLLDKNNARELFYVENKVLYIVSDSQVTKAYPTSEQAKKHLKSKLPAEDETESLIFY